MADAQTSAFLKNLRASGLLSTDQLAEIEQWPSAAEGDEQALARELVDRELLTGFQAKQLLAGRTQGFLIGPYTILDHIGAGGMGRVYKAVHRQLRRTVALKVLPRSRRMDRRARARFMREARASAQLEHPNIVTTYDVGQEGEITYLALQYIEGQSLYQVIRQQGRLAPSLAADITYQVALALQHAHERGVVHRDIKPSNILVTDRGMAKVLDMGLARLTRPEGDADGTGTLTSEGVVMGTLDYMAPEQASDTRTADVRSDIYSLGCTLYHMLTGRVPFPGGGPTEKLCRHALEAPEDPTKIVPDLPPELARVVARMITKLVDDRYQTPAEVASALLPWVGPDSAAPASGAIAASVSPTVTAEMGSTFETQVTGRGAGVDKETPPPGVYTLGPWWQRVPAWAWGTGAGVGVMLVLGVLFWPRATPHVPERPKAEKVPAPSSGTATAKQTRPAAIAPAQPEHNAHPAQSRPAKPPPPRRPGHAWSGMTGAEAKAVQAEGARLAGVLVTTPNSIGMKLVYIPPGWFMMGSGRSPEETERLCNIRCDHKILMREHPQHRVAITKGFYIGAHEVTQGQYEKVMGTNPSNFKKGPDYPVEKVNWGDAQGFCEKLSGMEDRTYRLPTEGEWEYACRAGTTTLFAFGDSLSVDEANCRGRKSTTLVGRFQPNAWGLHDMHGNVQEWCQDWHTGDYYVRSPESDPPGPPDPEGHGMRVTRGGWWSIHPFSCRSACRSRQSPSIRADTYGFRVVCVPNSPEKRD